VNPALASLERAAGEMRLSLPPGALERFDRYISEVLTWRRRINLTGASTALSLVALHFVDSLLPLAALEFPRGSRVADVGSGAGFPGLPIKIARPDLRVTLVEASSRRVAFLEHVRQALDLPDLEIVWGRAEDVAHQPEFRERFGVVLSRAAARASAAAELCLPFAALDGRVALLKGPGAVKELASAAPLIDRLGGMPEPLTMMHLPGTGQVRLLAVIKKVRPTGAGFPRRPPRLGLVP
jgi:16S rRNA (guanine527-N7)-methyltransferase